MDDLVLQILPNRGLDQSILVAVLVGMWILLSFTETFGWVFVGVVVPGYFASVLAIQPATALIIFLESLACLLISRFLAITLSKTGTWTEFFGRDRFFLIVLVSVLVRHHDQTWLFPLLARWFDTHLGTQLAIERFYFSIGLVLVPLTANMFWKLRLSRGFIQVSTVTLLTYAVLKFFLLPHTNLSLNSFELTYENTAVDFLGNAKAYIIMLVTAYVAGLFNFRYGWDYNGILIPALMALLWVTPSKLALTLLESVILLYAVQLFFQIPGIRTLNLEGPRKICTVFTLAFFLKWLVGMLIGDYFPGLNIMDMFAFGYLLSSLLTVRMLQKKSARAVLMPALTTSVIGYALGSLIGYGFSLVSYQDENSPNTSDSRMASTRLLATTKGALALARIRADLVRVVDDTLEEEDSETYSEMWDALVTWIESPNHHYLTQAISQSNRVGMQFSAIEERLDNKRRAYLLYPGEQTSGMPNNGDFALLMPGAQGPILEIPRPSRDAPLAEVSAHLCPRIDCRAILVAGEDYRESHQSFGNKPSSFDIAHSQLSRHGPVIRLYIDPRLASGKPVLHIQQAIPDSFDVHALWPEGIQLDWSEPPFASKGWLAGDYPWMIRFAKSDLELLLRNYSKTTIIDRDDFFLKDWIRDQSELSNDQNIDPPFVSPSASELRLLESFVAKPLLDSTILNSNDSNRLNLTAYYASLIDFEIFEVSHCDRGKPCNIASDRRFLPNKGWGTLIIRDGEASPIAFEVPWPNRSRSTRTIATELWQATTARTLLIAGADARTPSNSPDPVQLGNTRTAFQAIHQAIDGSTIHSSASDHQLIFQIRGIARKREIDADLVIGLGRPFLETYQIPPSLHRFLGPNKSLDWIPKIVFSDGSPSLHQLSGAGVPQVEFSLEMGRKNIATLWFSDSIRQRYHSPPHTAVLNQFLDIGFSIEHDDEVNILLQTWPLTSSTKNRPSNQSHFDELHRLTLEYSRTHNIHLLRKVRETAKNNKTAAIRTLIGRTTGRPIIAIEDHDEHQRYRAIVVLGDLPPTSEGGSDTRRIEITGNETDNGAIQQEVRRAILSRPRSIVVVTQRLIKSIKGIHRP